MADTPSSAPQGAVALAERLRKSADEVESFPHPSHCDHLHVAPHVMREAAEMLDRLASAPPVAAGEPTPLQWEDAAPPAPVNIGYMSLSPEDRAALQASAPPAVPAGGQEPVRVALAKLVAELSSLAIDAVREGLGNTNAAVLELRLSEACAALASPVPSPALEGYTRVSDEKAAEVDSALGLKTRLPSGQREAGPAGVRPPNADLCRASAAGRAGLGGLHGQRRGRLVA
jgi:hypothetical protein